MWGWKCFLIPLLTLRLQIVLMSVYAENPTDSWDSRKMTRFSERFFIASKRY
jgi:hypothetical protein